jgi:Uma2 family endonuclease
MNPSFSVQDDYPASIVLNFQEILKKLNDEDFEDFCRQNPDLKMELTKEGELIVIPPTGGRTGYRNFSLIVEFGKWSEKDGTGVGFDSSTVFVLPSGAKRSPDLAWVSNERWNSLSNEEQEKFPPLCPDFVVELRSRTDLLFTLQEKMREYVENGAQLGWLIDPSEKKVYVYRQGVEAEILDHPSKVSGEPLLKEFVLNLEKLW